MYYILHNIQAPGTLSQVSCLLVASPTERDQHCDLWSPQREICGIFPTSCKSLGGWSITVINLECCELWWCQGVFWPPGLVEWSRPGVGKILLRLVTNPSSMYPRVVSLVCKDQSVVRNISISKHRVESAVLWCTVATYVSWLREGSLSWLSCPQTESNDSLLLSPKGELWLVSS